MGVAWSLVPPLLRAAAVEQVHDVAVDISNHLHLDVPPPPTFPLQLHPCRHQMPSGLLLLAAASASARSSARWTTLHALAVTSPPAAALTSSGHRVATLKLL
jgi:hypothetical protein